MTRIAFYAPMKSPDHPVPSGDRAMARLLLKALKKTGYEADIASTLRIYDGKGDSAVQAGLRENAMAECARLRREMVDNPPQAWFTYHCYYKAPDLIGPAMAEAFDIPYLIAEASRARKRLTGPWAGFAQDAEAAISRAETLFAMTDHDRYALDRDAPEGQRVTNLPPFLEPGPDPAPPMKGDRARLLTVAMMRGEDKTASYRILAEALSKLDDMPWQLSIIGDGPRRDDVEAMFHRFGSAVQFCGQVLDSAELRRHYEAADGMIWPGVNEAYGMVYLEAQAAGTPIIAQDHPGPRSVIGGGSVLVADHSPAAFAQGIRAVIRDREGSNGVRDYVLQHHSIDQAAIRLREEIERLL